MKRTIEIPENETKNEKFVRIATPRVQAIISKLKSSPIAPARTMNIQMNRWKRCSEPS